MSDLKPEGVKIELGGQERTLLFTINVVDDIQERCNMPLIDAIGGVARFIDGNAGDHESIDTFRKVLTALLNGEPGAVRIEEKEVGDMVHIGNSTRIAFAILRAYGVSVPEPVEDESDDEDDDPNAETGQ